MLPEICAPEICAPPHTNWTSFQTRLIFQITASAGCNFKLLGVWKQVNGSKWFLWKEKKILTPPKCPRITTKTGWNLYFDNVIAPTYGMAYIYSVPKLCLSTLPQQVKKKSELGFNDFFLFVVMTKAKWRERSVLIMQLFLGTVFHKEGCDENGCFWTVELEKTLG